MKNPTRRLSRLQLQLLRLGFQNNGCIDSQMALSEFFGVGYGIDNHSHNNSISRAVGRLQERGLVQRSLRGQAILTPLAKQIFAKKFAVLIAPQIPPQAPSPSNPHAVQ